MSSGVVTARGGAAAAVPVRHKAVRMGAIMGGVSVVQGRRAAMMGIKGGRQQRTLEVRAADEVVEEEERPVSQTRKRVSGGGGHKRTFLSRAQSPSTRPS